MTSFEGFGEGTVEAVSFANGRVWWQVIENSDGRILRLIAPRFTIRTSCGARRAARLSDMVRESVDRTAYDTTDSYLLLTGLIGRSVTVEL